MLGGSHSDDDEDLDKKTAELEAKLAKLMVENEKAERERAKLARSQANLAQQIGMLKTAAVVFSKVTVEESTPARSQRYEEMRRRKDKRDGRLKHGVSRITAMQEESEAGNTSTLAIKKK